MSGSKVVQSVLAGMVISASAGVALAQDNAEGAQPNEIGELVVTAQKREQTLSDVPISITAQTGEQLKDKGIADVAELVKVTPGLSFGDSGRGVPVISLRGVGFFDTALGSRPTVSVYVDEAPLPFAIMTGGSTFDLERVEVLKGPQGTLFGQNSTGGAINFIAARPTSELKSGVTASYGRFNTIDLQGFVSGPLSDTLKARVAVRTLQADDWQYSYTRDDSLGEKHFFQGRALLDWDPTEDLRVRLSVSGFHDGSDTQAVQLIGTRRVSPSISILNNYPAPPSNNRAADWVPGQAFERDDDLLHVALRTEYDVSPELTIISLTSYADMSRYLFADIVGANVPYFLNLTRGDVQTISQELRATGNVGALTYLVGGSYARDKTVENSRALLKYGAPVGGAIDDVITPSVQKFETIAAFADMTYQLTDQVRLTGGVRYTQQDLRYVACQAAVSASAAAAYTSIINGTRAGLGLAPIGPLPPGSCTTVDEQILPALAIGGLKEDNISWRALVDFKPTSGTMLYASISRGYKAGSSPSPSASSVVQFQPVRQESVLAYEAGVKSALFDRIVDLSAAAFYYDYKDKQLLGRAVYTPNVFGPVNALVNIPKSRVYGFEAQVTVRPSRLTTVSAATTYLNTKVESDFLNYSLLGNQVNFRGQRFPYTPAWQLVLDFDHRIPLSDGLVGVVGANANYRSKTKAGFGSEPLIAIDSYWLVDLRLGVEADDGRWKAQLFGRNVFNQFYWNNVASASDAIRRFTGMPATYGVQVSFDF